MRKCGVIAAASLFVLAGPGLRGAQRLTLDVSPAVAPAPGDVSVRVLIDANDDNRELRIVAQSPDFIRSSTIELHGASAPRVSVVEYANLPAGVYQVSGFLLGTRGERAEVTRMVKIVPSVGRR